MKFKILLLAAVFSAPAAALDFSEANVACFAGASFIKAALLARYDGVPLASTVITIQASTKNKVVIEEFTYIAQAVYELPPVRGAAAQLAQAESERKAAYMRCMTAYGY